MRDIDVQIPIEWFDELDSTSAEARRDVESGELGDQPRMYVARRQKAGRGRLGRSWASPEGGLWTTLAWPANREPSRVLEGLGLRIGMALVKTIEHALATHGHGEPVRLKWPNDALVKGRKVAGALTESIVRDGKTYILVGVGVNANFPTDALPPELRERATTLQDLVHAPTVLQRLAEDVRERLLEALMEEGIPPKLVNEARSYLAGVNEHTTITLPDGTRVEGVLRGLTDNGLPRVQTDEGEWVPPMSAVIE